MQEKPFWFSRHARNRMRRDHVPREAVEECIVRPEAVISSVLERKNYWVPHEGGYLRVTIAEEPDRLVVVSVVLKARGPG